MAVISSAKFVAVVEAISNDEPRYEQGHDGSDGFCDCIGLIIGAIRRAGGQWRGLHGSNYAARREMTTLSPIWSVDELTVGEVVYKHYIPGQGGYALPKRYEKGGEYYNGDLNDYYHVGIVISVSPLRIRHMTTPKPKIDKDLGKWSHHGKLSKIEYGGGGGQMEPYQARVVGGKLNFREQPNKNADRICQIPEGTILNVTDEAQEWAMTSYNGQTGWVLGTYLEKTGMDSDTVVVNRKDLEHIFDLIADLLGKRG